MMNWVLHLACCGCETEGLNLRSEKEEDRSEEQAMDRREKAKIESLSYRLVAAENEGSFNRYRSKMWQVG